MSLKKNGYVFIFALIAYVVVRLTEHKKEAQKS